MARSGTRETRTGAGGPEDRIRSIYAARSAASGRSTTGDFVRIKSSDPDRSLRAAYLSHLSKSKEEAPREARGPGESALRKAYLARTIAHGRSR